MTETQKEDDVKRQRENTTHPQAREKGLGHVLSSQLSEGINPPDTSISGFQLSE